jgi:hypothetical protein
LKWCSALEEASPWSQEHEIGVPRFRTIEKRISSVEWRPEGRVVGWKECERFGIHVWSQGPIIDHQMPDELFKSFVLTRPDQPEVAKRPTKRRAFVDLISLSKTKDINKRSQHCCHQGRGGVESRRGQSERRLSPEANFLWAQQRAARVDGSKIGLSSRY